MICEYYNSLMDTCGFIMDGKKTSPLMHEREVSLFGVIALTCYTLIVILVLGWWIIPIRFISNKLPTFKCKRFKK